MTYKEAMAKFNDLCQEQKATQKCDGKDCSKCFVHIAEVRASKEVPQKAFYKETVLPFYVTRTCTVCGDEDNINVALMEKENYCRNCGQRLKG